MALGEYDDIRRRPVRLLTYLKGSLVRELIVVAFEVAGLVALAIGIGMAVATVATAAGVAAGALALLGEAAVLEWRTGRRSTS